MLALGAGFGAGNAGGFADVFGDIFGDFMGAGAQGARASPQAHYQGSDLQYNIKVTLEEAFNGCEKVISFRAPAICKNCSGKGSKTGKVQKCKTCHGSGYSRIQQGFFVMEQTCPACKGAGESVVDPCPSCRGEGRSMQERKIKVKIPVGVADRSKIRVSGEGEAGYRGAKAGDLYVVVHLQKHPVFDCARHDLTMNLPMSMVVATLGGEVEVPCIEGSKIKVKVPAGTQNATKLKVPSKGMKIMNTGGRRGNMILNVKVEIPVKLSTEQKNILEQFNNALESGNKPEESAFWGKIKGFFDKKQS